MAKLFNPTLRVLFENSADHLNGQVIAKLAEIEAEARQMRAENARQETEGRRGEKHIPAMDLKPKIDALRSALVRGRLETIDAIDGEFAEMKSSYQKDRARHADQSLLEIRDAENKFHGLTDDECTELVFQYGTGADLNLAELNALKGRLRDQNATPELDALKRTIKSRRADTPWLDGEGRKIADYRDQMQNLQGGELLYVDQETGETIKTDFEDLIDFDGELDTVE